jgi:AbrB family looped-hinge helix DNA binding protein
MPTTRLSTKGQIVLPLAVRASRQWPPGTEFTVEETSEGILLRPLDIFPPTTLDQVAGCLPVKGKARTIAQMDRGVRREVIRRRDRGRY